MASMNPDVVKETITAHWDRRAGEFDNDFGHSIGGPAERAAWDRVLALLLGDRQQLKALDVGCGTGFLAFELAARGHEATGIDLAPAMIAEARRKVERLGLPATFERGDAEQVPFPSDSFDMVISRHVLWTLPHPEQAIDDWIRVVRPGGRVAIVDGQFELDTGARAPGDRPILQSEYGQIRDQLPFMGGRPQAEVLELLRAHGLVSLGGDGFTDLVEAQMARAKAEGRPQRNHRRYIVWGDVPVRV